MLNSIKFITLRGDRMDKDYVQYSKRVTKWAMILIAFVMIACLAVVAFVDIPANNVNAVV